MSDKIYVIIVPPGVGGNSGYVIGKSQLSGSALLGYLKQDGTWASEYAIGEAFGFNTARDAIEWAEKQSWVVMNKGQVK